LDAFAKTAEPLADKHTQATQAIDCKSKGKTSNGSSSSRCTHSHTGKAYGILLHIEK
jgi:hypothetical protein